MSIIVLANNDTPALISTCDAERVATRYWRASYENKHWYVISSASSSGPRVSLHRFIMDAGPRQMVDHRFGDGFDNRREMLRFCNNSQNGANTPNRKRPTSGYYGVSVANGGLMWYRNPWQVIMRVHGKVTYLGRYATAEEAARVYDAKAREVYGEFATLNFPDEVEHEDAA
ncbi:MAG: hypothetical protein IT337_05410 [Thermomicrobiales bacterium]|nr:hypothetical protein [Thermomicrobiales bacterium]